MRMRAIFFWLVMCSLVACDGGGLPAGLHNAPSGTGPRIVWDLEAKPIANIPLPNDIATVPDNNAPTGLHLNASLVAPTILEHNLRENFNELDGWGTFAPITVAFDAPIDFGNLLTRQGKEAFSAAAWPTHGVYVVNLTTGIPVPLEIGAGTVNLGLSVTDQYGPNDPRSKGSNLLYETYEEDRNHNGLLDPGEDTDFDGVLDHPNTLNGMLPSADLTDTYNALLVGYERETNTLVLRPVVPLEEETRYAVVITDRVVGVDGTPVRSPFDSVHHLSQAASLAKLPSEFAAHPEIFGDLSSAGWNHVAFAWSFTTQSVSRDLKTIREGFDGKGLLSDLQTQYPPELMVARAQEDPSDGTCMGRPELGKPYIATSAQMKEVAKQIAGQAFGLSDRSVQALADSFENIDHFVVGFFKAPYFLHDPNDADFDAILNSKFEIDYMRGDTNARDIWVPMLIAVPKATASFHAPFPTAFYSHSYSSTHLESLGFAGLMAKQGIATVALVAPSHGLGVSPLVANLLHAVFAVQCLAPMADAVGIDRARDWTGDGVPDSGADFWTAYPFHTRDMIRQSAVEEMLALRVLKGFDGTRRAISGKVAATRSRFNDAAGNADFDNDGMPNLAGDFDADGVVDVGGPANHYYAWGQSLGAIVAATAAGAEPTIEAAAPTSGAGGLMEVSLRSTEDSVVAAVLRRLLGPLVFSEPSSAADPKSTACDANSRSMRFFATNGNESDELEIGCVPNEMLAEGDAVVAFNLVNGEVRCAGVGTDGRFRIALPTDAGDQLEIQIFHGAASNMDYGACTFLAPEAAPSFVQDRWTSGMGTCVNCGLFGKQTFATGDFLVAPSAGFGLRRQTPEFRRILSLSQVALEAGDPVNYARRYFLDPYAGGSPRSLLVLAAYGDVTVPIHGAHHLARAAGILPFMPADAPDVFANYRAPADFVSRYPGESSPSALLVDKYVTEGLSELNRFPQSYGDGWLLDADYLGEGAQLYLSSSGGFPSGSQVGHPSPGLTPALRWVRESRAVTSPADDVWTAANRTHQTSGVLGFIGEPDGAHGFKPPDPEKIWDEGVYLTNLVGWYLSSGGRDLLYHSSPTTHECLENSSCVYAPMAVSSQ